MMPYPWLKSFEQMVIDWLAQDRVPGGLLISGEQGVGKDALANAVAGRLLCQNSNQCGECRHCELLRSSSHPDLTVVERLENKQSLSIEQIRELQVKVGQTSQAGGYRVVIIREAHLLTIAAANALLKTLEEPGSRVLIIMLTTASSRILPTVRSRCQQWKIAGPTESLLIEWLTAQGVTNIQKRIALVGHMPLRLCALSEEELGELEEISKRLQSMRKGAELTMQRLAEDLDSKLDAEQIQGLLLGETLSEMKRAILDGRVGHAQALSQFSDSIYEFVRESRIPGRNRRLLLSGLLVNWPAG